MSSKRPVILDVPASGMRPTLSLGDTQSRITKSSHGKSATSFACGFCFSSVQAVPVSPSVLGSLRRQPFASLHGSVFPSTCTRPAHSTPSLTLPLSETSQLIPCARVTTSSYAPTSSSARMPRRLRGGLEATGPEERALRYLKRRWCRNVHARHRSLERRRRDGRHHGRLGLRIKRAAPPSAVREAHCWRWRCTCAGVASNDQSSSTCQRERSCEDSSARVARRPDLLEIEAAQTIVFPSLHKPGAKERAADT